MKIKKLLSIAMSLMLGVSFISTLAGCGGKEDIPDTITMVWYPNESGEDFKDARDEIGKVVAGATGKKVEHKTTTDYSIAIESLANGTASICFMGPQGYVEAHAKNENVVPLVVNTGKSGTLEDAMYYSWLSVQKDKVSEYKVNGEYSLDTIVGKKMSFVSNSSTSGFKVPTSSILTHFRKMDKWKDLTAEDLMEGGNDKLFGEVLYGGTHQGSAVNLLTGKSEVAAFCDTVLINYVEAVSGDFNGVGTTYKVKDNAAEPFNNLRGQEFTCITSTPVLNSPFAVNKDVISDEDLQKIITALTSDEVANNEKIFVPKGKDFKGFMSKEGNEKFITVEDAWFEPIRALSK